MISSCHHRARRSFSASRLGVALAGLLAGCSTDSFNITDTNGPTVDQLTGSPTRTILARAARGLVAGLPGVGAAFVYAVLGREGWNLVGNDPRTTGELLHGPLLPDGFGSAAWDGPYHSIRSINVYLTALVSAKGLSPQEVAASRGYAQTLKAHAFHLVIVRNGTLGIPIDVDRPIDADPAPFVTQEAAYDYVVALLDSAKASLDGGGDRFPFTIPPGFEVFPAPADFVRFNRGLLAEIQIHRATFATCGSPCFAAALAALNQSFISTGDLPGSLSLGANHFFSAAAGEPSNGLAEALSAKGTFVHPSLLTGVQRKPDGSPDDRYTDKVRETEPYTFDNLTGSLKLIRYNINTPTSSEPNLAAPVPLLKNEELILLRAEANLGLGNIQAALNDINLIRIHSGGLPPSTLTSSSPKEDVLTELLYNRLYSLLWEQGTRWIDARRYHRTATLPLDRPGDVIFPNMVVPATECDARRLPRPCEPLQAGH